MQKNCQNPTMSGFGFELCRIPNPVHLGVFLEEKANPVQNGLCMYACSHMMGAFTPNSPSVRQQMINGYQLRDRQERGRRDLSDRSNMVASPPRRLIMFAGAHSGMIAYVDDEYYCCSECVPVGK